MSNLESSQTLSQPAEGSGDEQSSPDLNTLVSTVKNLEAQLRGLQAEKDRAVSKTNQRLDGFDEAIQRYARYAGVPVDGKALRDMRLDDLLEGGAMPARPSVGAEAQAAQGQAVKFTEMYQAVGLDANDNEVLNLTMQHAGKPEVLKAKLMDLKLARNQAPVPSAASVAAPSGGSPPANLEAEAASLQAELAQLATDPRRNFAAIQTKTARLRQITS